MCSSNLSELRFWPDTVKLWNTLRLISEVIFQVKVLADWGEDLMKMRDWALHGLFFPDMDFFFQRAIAILEIEKAWLWRQGGKRRSGCLMSVGLNKKDERWCFR